MSKKTILALSAVMAVSIMFPALADTRQGESDKTEIEGSAGMTMGDSQMAMMMRMMKMHGSMMGGQGTVGMMDRDMIATMMPGGDLQNIRAHMDVKLREFDADGDDSLTLEEFEVLHMNAVRDRMVDRFQHLDADADGQVTQEEMAAAGTRMSTMQNICGDAATEDHHCDDKE
jgi:hypothetical protein